MKEQIAGGDAVAIQPVSLALHVGEASAGLLNQQPTRSYIPGMQAELPERAILIKVLKLAKRLGA